MILKRIRVQNFRSIRDVTLVVGSQLAIVGGNGAGKSTVLRAIEKFYSPSATVEPDDFYGRQFTAPIQIELTFTAFNDSERELFASRIHDDEMTVVREFDAAGGRNNGRYFGVTRGHEGFNPIRTANGARAQREVYDNLAAPLGPYDLPPVRRGDQIPDALARWERDHPDQCTLTRDDGQFFGFTNVARGALSKATSFVFIPAVRDASADALDARGAVIARLLELVVKSAIQRRSDIREFQVNISQQYRELTDPSRLHELGGLAEELTRTLQVFYKETAVNLAWRATDDFAVPLPQADVSLSDDGFEGPVDRKGHGLQRAFILTLLQHLAAATSAENEVRELMAAESGPERPSVLAPEDLTAEATARHPMPGLILAIEEPELYQHPTKQRHFANVLTDLSSGELVGVAQMTQVLFATHSSLFVSMDRFDEVCLARRQRVEGQDHKECRLTTSQLSSVAKRMEGAYAVAEGTYSGEGLKSRLHIIGSEVAEGFFADTVVLVEGTSDRAAITAAARLRGIDLEALGIAILPVGGVGNLDRPLAIFTELGIPTYSIWDCDAAKQHVEQNLALQVLSGVRHEDALPAVSIVAEKYACFETKLEDVIKVEIGADRYAAFLEAAKARFDAAAIPNDRAVKSPNVMWALLTEAAKENLFCQTLDSIIARIVALAGEIAPKATADGEMEAAPNM